MKKLFGKIDKPLLLLTIGCLIFGILMIGSASSLKSYMVYGTSYRFLIKQIVIASVGVIGALIVLKIPIKTYNKLIYFGIVGIIMALVYVLFKGDLNRGITGWITLGPITLQPSEFAKTILIVYYAVVFENMMRIKNAPPRDAKNIIMQNVIKMLPFIVPLIIMLLVFKQPDLGTMAIIAAITLMAFIVVPYDLKTKLVFAGLATIMVLILVTAMTVTGKGLTDAQKSRLNFKYPCTRYREPTGYQVCNGFIAINSGGLFGTGLGNSKQKYLYLPEAHTDFIYAIIIEETGMITGIFIMLVYFIMLYRILLIGRKSYNLQGTMICYCVAAYISAHIILNLTGVLGLLPLTGVPLPFYSYGGSFIINLLVCIGLVQRVSIENKLFEQKHLVR